MIIPWPKPKFFENPESWQDQHRVVGEVLNDLSKKSPVGRYKNHFVPSHTKVVSERFSYIEEGEKLNVESLPNNLKIGEKTGKPISNYSGVYRRLHRDKPSNTIVPGHNAFPVHPTLNRTLTIREAARIQTFPDNFEFVGPIVQQGLQVGNAFPCLVVQIVGERLRTVVNRNWSARRTTNLAKYSMLEK